MACLLVALSLLPLLLGLFDVLQSYQHLGRIVFPLDDPYIHLRFARNIAAGDGFAFNPGEPTPGVTSPVWVLLLAGSAAARLPPEATMLALSLASSSLAVFATIRLATALELPVTIAILAGLLMGLSGRFAWMAASGMEACLAAALAAIAVTAAARFPRSTRHTLLLGLLVGVAVQTRPELAVLAFLIGAVEVARVWKLRVGVRASRHRRSRRPADATFLWQPVLYAIVVALLQLPYVIFCLATTGRPLPNTVYAKALIPFEAGAWGPVRLGYALETFRWLWQDNFLLPLLLVVGAILWIRARRSLIVVLFPIMLWVLAILLFPAHYNMSRYDIPLAPLLCVVAAGSIHSLGMGLQSPVQRRLLLVGAIVVCVAGGVVSERRYHRAYERDTATTDALQVSAAQWIATHVPSGARIATHDVGALGYYSDDYIIDIVGLVSSGVIDAYKGVNFHTTPGTAPLYAFLARQQPQYVAIFPAWYPDLAAQPELQPLLHLHHVNTTQGADDLVIYKIATNL